MRTLLLASLAALAVCAGCGQKGALVLPPKSVATPVVIRAPAPPEATAAPATAPAPKKDDVPEPPPSPKR